MNEKLEKLFEKVYTESKLEGQRLREYHIEIEDYLASVPKGPNTEIIDGEEVNILEEPYKEMI